ncbi:MAG: PEBP family protein [Parcubacteria group bacterium GW2011_GWA1_54_9]|nr:MAG: PEBP family protein [Parcubacteria group bacterium GW2011_GWA1_54_9]
MLALQSSAFEHNGKIPVKYTCDLPAQAGGDPALSPPLSINGVPEAAKTLVLIMDDPDVPKALRPEGVFDHWVLFNVPPETREIREGETVGTPGATTRGDLRYTGPCPPPEYEPSEHRYVFKLYALSAPLTLSAGATKREVLDALAPLLIEETELIGRYSRK